MPPHKVLRLACSAFVSVNMFGAFEDFQAYLIFSGGFSFFMKTENSSQVSYFCASQAQLLAGRCSAGFRHIAFLH